MFKKILNKIKPKKQNKPLKGYISIRFDSKKPKIYLNINTSVEYEDFEEYFKSEVPEMKNVKYIKEFLKKNLETIYPLTIDNLKFLLISLLIISGKLEDGKTKEDHFLLSIDADKPHLVINFAPDAKIGKALTEAMKSIKNLYIFKKYKTTSKNIDILREDIKIYVPLLDYEIQLFGGESFRDYIN